MNSNSLYVTCSKCGQDFYRLNEYKKYNCQEADCFDVPAGFEHAGIQKNFAVAGPIQSGKSYYIYALLNELSNPFGETYRFLKDRLDIRVEIDHRSVPQIDELVQKVKAGKNWGTNPGDKENNYPLVVVLSRGNEWKIQLTFYDIAGEIYHCFGEKKVSNIRQIYDASGFIFLVPPTSDEYLNRLLKSQAVDPPSITIEKCLEKLYNGICENYKEKIRPLPLKLAVCFSKYDLLDHLRGTKLPDPYLDIEDLFDERGKFIKKAVSAKSMQLADIIKDNCTFGIKDFSDYFHKIAFFGMSSVGTVANHNRNKIEPKGILAPLLWLLSEHEYI